MLRQACIARLVRERSVRWLLALPFLLLLAACTVIPNRALMPGKPLPQGWLVFAPKRQDYDTPPQLLHGNAPIYPIGQLLDEKGGLAVVTYTIGSDGHTSNFHVLEASNPYFASHLIHAMQGWLFQPAMKDGHPVAITVQQEMNFQVDSL